MDVYTYLKLREDTSKINYFLLKVSKEDELEGRDSTSFDAAMGYYFSISYELGHTNTNFYQNKIGGREFKDKISEA